jgi:glycosyltransferase involved in cell wall biosynthesis
MKITIDALPLIGDTGVTTYLYNLIKNMISVDNKNRYELLYRLSLNFKNYNFEKFNSNSVSIRNTHIPNRIFEYFYTFNRHRVPLLDGMFNTADVFFSTVYFVPCIKKSVVSVVYDITPFKIDEYSNEREMLKIRLRNVIKYSNHIITISNSTKNDLCNFFNMDEKKISVTYLAASDIYTVMNKVLVDNYLKSKYHIDSGYILYVGNKGSHKNVISLLEAYKKIKKDIKRKLVLCGKKAWSGSVREAIKNLSLVDDVIIPGYVPLNDLPYIYNGASVFVYPSRYEGFGLPVLEAMSCGVPIITSNISSLPEVAGDAAILIDPYKVDEISEAIKSILSSPSLYQKLSSKSLERSKIFGWEKTAKDTLSIFYEAAK